MICTERRILLKSVFSLQRCRWKFVTVYKIYLIFFIHDSVSSLAQKSCQRIGCASTSGKNSSHSGKISFSSGFNRQFKCRCHFRHISGRSNRSICHNCGCTHLHCFTCLRWFSDSRIYNDRKINLINQYLDHSFCCKTFVAANWGCQRHNRSCTCILKVSCHIQIRIHIRQNNKSFLSQNLRCLDRFIVIWVKILRITHNFNFYKISTSHCPAQSRDTDRLFCCSRS